MDDILVFGTDETEHWVRLRTVLEKIERAGMTLRKDKCEFGKSSVWFLGHVVSGGTIGADPAKVEFILNLDLPTDKKGERLTTLVNSVRTQLHLPNLSMQ